MTSIPEDAWQALQASVVDCRQCPRLVGHREAAGADPPRRHRGETYWSRPVPSLGDPRAPVWIVGLAPSAQGANRTGRMFTGDPSAAFLAAALHRAGFATQPTSERRGDGFALTGTFITAAVRCAPPENRPSQGEMAACEAFLDAEWAFRRKVSGAPPPVVVALGRLAHDAVRSLLERAHGVSWPFAFRHGLAGRTDAGTALLATYHPSPQNTHTGRLTAEMLDDVLRAARGLSERPDPGVPVRIPRRRRNV